MSSNFLKNPGFEPSKFLAFFCEVWACWSSWKFWKYASFQRKNQVEYLCLNGSKCQLMLILKGSITKTPYSWQLSLITTFKFLICEYLMYNIQGKCLSIDPCSSWGTQSQKSLSFLIFGKIIPWNDSCSQGAWKLLFSFKLVSILCINPRRVSRHRSMHRFSSLQPPPSPIKPVTLATAQYLICVDLMYKNSRKVPKHRLELVF